MRTEIDLNECDEHFLKANLDRYEIDSTELVDLSAGELVPEATSTRIRFHSVFILFQVMGPLFSTPLRTENNIKPLGKRIRVDVA